MADDRSPLKTSKASKASKSYNSVPTVGPLALEWTVAPAEARIAKAVEGAPLVAVFRP